MMKFAGFWKKFAWIRQIGALSNYSRNYSLTNS